MSCYFIAGIDTEVGKTVVTGLLGRWCLMNAMNACSMKLVETGLEDGGLSQDILTHRRIMGLLPLDEDREGTTCPYRFRLPASPHLSASRENRVIEPQKIRDAAEKLQKKFDLLLVEGVGGLLVPLSPNDLAVDLVQQIKAPVILVTSGRLGGINHTLLSLEALAARSIPLAGLVYNRYGNLFGDTAEEIQRGSLDFFHRQLEKQGLPGALVEIPAFDLDHPPDIDFSPLVYQNSRIFRK